MATTILIVCPECGKQIKAPENVLGKRVRCKFCQAAFVASQGAAKPPAGKPAKPPAGKPAASKPAKPAKPAVEDDEDDPNPYGIIDVDLTPRCPNCANEIENEGAVICLTCGYNTQTREQIKIRKIHGHTTGEQILWLLPGIACVLVIIGTLIFDIWYLMKIGDLVDTNEIFWGILAHKGIKFWVVLISLFIIFFTGRFALKRLILHHAPPEIEKTK